MVGLEEMNMRHIDELQIAGTAVLLCVAMFGVSAVAPKDSKVSKGVTTFTEAPETAAEAEAQAQAEAEENGFPIYTQESNYDDSGSTDWDYDSGSYEEDPGNNNDNQDSSGDGSTDGSGDGSADQDSSDNGDGSDSSDSSDNNDNSDTTDNTGDGDQIDYPDESTDTSGDDTSEDFSYQDTAPSDPGQE